MKRLPIEQFSFFSFFFFFFFFLPFSIPDFFTWREPRRLEALCASEPTSSVEMLRYGVVTLGSKRPFEDWERKKKMVNLILNQKNKKNFFIEISATTYSVKSHSEDSEEAALNIGVGDVALVHRRRDKLAVLGLVRR